MTGPEIGPEFTARDRLALDRAALACERGLLGCIQASLALLVGGLLLGRLVHTAAAQAAAWALAAAAVVVLAVGAARYLRGRAGLKAARRNAQAMLGGGRPRAWRAD